MVDNDKIEKMFEYLSASSSELEKADGAFVFGRSYPLVASRVADLYSEGLMDYVMITGGIGKDSGSLKKLRMPEAMYQGALLVWEHGFPPEKLFLEKTAENGGECCRKGIDTIFNANGGEGLPHAKIITVVHATSLRRVQATLEVEGTKKGFDPNYQTAVTRYGFNPGNPRDQKEAVEEMLRLADWPGKGWCTEQSDLSQDLVDYARHLLPSL
jgi:hypothetical protein